jgi:hypothetical protein
MIVDSGFLARLAQALQTARAEPGDTLLRVPPDLTPILPLGSPSVVLTAGAVLNSGGHLSFDKVNSNTAGTNDVIATLAVGVWRLRIHFASVQDFTGFAAGGSVNIRIPNATGPITPLVKHTPVLNIANYSVYEETLYIQQTSDLVVTTPASGVGQNAATSTQLTAQKLL